MNEDEMLLDRLIKATGQTRVRKPGDGSTAGAGDGAVADRVREHAHISLQICCGYDPWLTLAKDP